ncbi:sulfite exporter TauE/SafE family protein [Marinomonas sp. C2222]|uniref:Probable membrane transporter protein n=1 Tax=Marinomonas sargassi TaxID=2984494 RepID=A0ABT2YRB8_9GAMM|nr:sulfite exporter TauE/SafE family protein [Marinomonas sargassi]MCV2402406.1 sulfite exporter TauE/SafE family protein [Marinomonas sargassi]
MPLEEIWILVLVVTFAAFVRGYSGFGFAAIAVVGINLFLSPQQSIPIVLGLDVICSAPLFRQALRQADMPTLKFLTLGAIIGIPVGLSLLLLVPSETLKLLICIAILIFSVLLLLDIRIKNTDKTPAKLGFGVLAGTGTSGASIGGPMVVCYMLSSSLSATVQRATMIMFFIMSESISMGGLFISNLVGLDVIKLIAILLIPSLIAVKVGQWAFNRKPPKSLKHFALPIMVTVALLGVSASIGEAF